MTISKKVMLPLAAVAVVGAAGLYGLSQVSADSSSTDPRASLVQKLSDTFHLDKSKVQAVFDEDRKAHEAEHEANYEERLNQAVTDGKLTADQKTAVLAEHKLLKTKLEAAMSKTGTERHDAMEAVLKEGKTWANDHNIDAMWLLPGGPGGPGKHGIRMHGGGEKWGHGMGMNDKPKDAMAEDNSGKN